MNKIKDNVPNTLTIINLSLGIIAILFAVNDKTNTDYLIPASLLILVAALTDRFDGKIARKLNVTSELGKELDSLADLISFGVAPTIIAWKICFMHIGVGGYLLSLLFPIAGAYRLARYNSKSSENYFVGMPITLAGAFLAITNIYSSFSELNDRFSSINIIVTAVIIVLLSFLMISTIKFRKL